MIIYVIIITLLALYKDKIILGYNLIKYSKFLEQFKINDNQHKGNTNISTGNAVSLNEEFIKEQINNMNKEEIFNVNEHILQSYSLSNVKVFLKKIILEF